MPVRGSVRTLSEPTAAISVPVPAQRFAEIGAEVVAALTAAATQARDLLLGGAT